MQPAAFWQLVAFVDIVLTQQMCIFFVKLSSFVCVCTLCVPQSRSALFSMRLQLLVFCFVCAVICSHV